MSRKRIIDAEALCADYELVEALGERGMLLYVVLWGYAEDWGGYAPDYDKIALKTGWLRFTPQEVQKYIDKLICLGKIVVYSGNGCGPKRECDSDSWGGVAPGCRVWMLRTRQLPKRVLACTCGLEEDGRLR